MAHGGALAATPTVQVTRRAVLWVPDWPVVAALKEAHLTVEVPAAVMRGRAVVAVSAAARAAGVRRGMRQRLAQSRCPEVVLLRDDPLRDVRAFESVAQAAETVVPGMEIARPGLLLIPSHGAARFHGGEEALAEALVTAVAEQAGDECAVGMADGLLAAVVAARAAAGVPPARHALVPPGASAAYLAPLPVDTLVLAAMDATRRAQVEAMVDVLLRLGITTVGQFTALPAAHILARFGVTGMWARRMAWGQDVTPPVLRRQDADIRVEYVFEEPAQRVEQLTHVAAALAQELDQALLAAGSRCPVVCIAATTTHGQTLERRWHTDVGSRSGAFARHMAERVRWQLEGWLAGGATDSSPEPAALTTLSITALDVVAWGEEQAYLWGGVSGADARAHRAVERLQSLLGLDGVLAAHEQGGRSPRERALLASWGQAVAPRPVEQPWPGRLPDPPPATVFAAPRPAQVLDAGGSAVRIDRRLGMSAPPTWVRLPADPRDPLAQAMSRHPSTGGVRAARRAAGAEGEVVWDSPIPVDSWAGPWAVAQRWWAEDASRKAYLQVALRGGAGGARALLVACEAGVWAVEAVYD